jgi:hypothetical protein
VDVIGIATAKDDVLWEQQHSLSISMFIDEGGLGIKSYSQQLPGHSMAEGSLNATPSTLLFIMPYSSSPTACNTDQIMSKEGGGGKRGLMDAQAFEDIMFVPLQMPPSLATVSTSNKGEVKAASQRQGASGQRTPSI